LEANKVEDIDANYGNCTLGLPGYGVLPWFALTITRFTVN
jgi:hypothetical protein